MRRAMLLVVVVTAILTPGLARANDPLYPITSFLDWLQNTQHSFQDGSGQYTLEEGFIGAARRELRRLPASLQNAPADQLQAVVDALLHMRPDLPYSHVTDAGNPAYEPDFNHNGIFGDSGGTDLNAVSDYDADTDAVMDRAPFHYPCYTAADQWRVHYRTTSGACDTSGTSKALATGIAREVKIIDARGLLLDATLWIPGSALTTAAKNERYPGVVFSNGVASRQDMYYWFAERMAGAGYIVLTYDPAGQGESQGNIADLFDRGDSAAPSCEFVGACHDIQDVLRWFAGQRIVRVADSTPRIAPRLDPARNTANPYLSLLDTSRISIAGNSMGALSLLSYVQALSTGKGSDGRPLPPIVSAVALSGAAPTHAVVPIQFQTSDYDGSPTLVGPDVGGVYLGGAGQGIGYGPEKTLYDKLRTEPHASPLELLVLEGGVHTDSVDTPFVTRTLWANSLEGDYALDWIDCYAKREGSACTRAVAPRSHLSRAFASERTTAGRVTSYCISVPTEASLAQSPADFAKAETGKPVYDCAR